MNVEEYLDDIKSIQSEFLEFIEEDENDEEKFYNLSRILEDKKIRDNKHNLRLFLHHIASVCAHHPHSKNFFSKIERVIQIFKDDIKNYYINPEIFTVFKKNKRILLFLIEEKMLVFDEYVAKKIITEKYVTRKYPQYFAPEMEPFTKESWFPKYDPNAKYNKNEWVEEIKKELPANFHELRKTGENERYISKLIRDDNAEDFIAYMNQGSFPLKSKIEPSIYETNAFLIKKQNESGNKNKRGMFSYNQNSSNESGVTLIEYAAFFGSIQIIKYLQMQGVEMTPSLWLYATHSQNAELIHFLEDSHIEPTVTVRKDYKNVEEKSYEECFMESIKCNYNSFANYFFDNYLQGNDQIQNDTLIQSLKYYNFEFLQKELANESSFCLLCTYDYYLFVDDALTYKDIKINLKII